MPGSFKSMCYFQKLRFDYCILCLWQGLGQDAYYYTLETLGIVNFYGLLWKFTASDRLASLEHALVTGHRIFV